MPNLLGFFRSRIFLIDNVDEILHSRHLRSVVAKSALEPLDPATVDDETLIGDGCAVFCSQEKNKASNLVRPNDPLQCLPGKDLSFVGFGKPKPFLPLCLNRAGHDAIDSDIVNA